MKGALSKIPPTTLQQDFKREMDILLDLLGSVRPDLNHGPWIIEYENEQVLIMSSKYFWSIMWAISRYISEKNTADYSLKSLLTYLKEENTLLPNQDKMTNEEFKNRLTEEYLFIGMKNYNIFAPLFQKIKGNKYIQGGILHVLAYHYKEFKKILANNKKKTLFPDYITINEVIGSFITIAKDGNSEKQDDGKIKIKGKVKLNLSNHNQSNNCCLIIDPIDQKNISILTTFFKE